MISEQESKVNNVVQEIGTTFTVAQQATAISITVLGVAVFCSLKLGSISALPMD
jgi:hypothetical protein